MELRLKEGYRSRARDYGGHQSESSRAMVGKCMRLMPDFWLAGTGSANKNDIGNEILDLASEDCT